MNTRLFTSAALAGFLAVPAMADKQKDKKAEAAKDSKDESGYCYGVNACKGQGNVCSGKVFGASNSCAGSNECAGKGVLKMNKNECLKKKGQFALKLEH